MNVKALVEEKSKNTHNRSRGCDEPKKWGNWLVRREAADEFLPYGSLPARDIL